MVEDDRMIPTRDCVNFEHHGWACKVQHKGWRYCPVPHYPCRCSSYKGKDGITGAQLWPTLDPKPA